MPATVYTVMLMASNLLIIGATALLGYEFYELNLGWQRTVQKRPGLPPRESPRVRASASSRSKGAPGGSAKSKTKATTKGKRAAKSTPGKAKTAKKAPGKAKTAAKKP